MTTTIPADAESLAARFQALADEKRVRILNLLRGGERCVCDINADLDVSQPLVSFHLKTLREAGLVRDRRRGRWVYYSLVPEALDELGDFLEDVEEAARTCRIAFDGPGEGCC